ncbi:Uma2 family endonuclease [Spirosoma sp. KNUC1025]|uniref:Uma2 family endonuclease n=1 Tax=Spirosoma sp. KNUC1025 TaxID=2894082 RepID=UPI0038668E5D|nr:Uma2 family endonuclease [Spirosoma sp. KNUC1025]
MRAPDVAWIRLDRWDALCKKDKHSFPHLAPDFVLELVSDSNNLDLVKAKMEKWLANGVRLAWLVSPEEKQTYIYRPGQAVEARAFIDTLSGDNVLVGFETVLANILEE